MSCAKEKVQKETLFHSSKFKLADFFSSNQLKASIPISLKFLLSVTFLLFLPKVGFSQTEKATNSRQITEIDLKDPVIIEKISQLIDTAFVTKKREVFDPKISPFKQGAGYILLEIWNNQTENFRTKYVVKADLSTLEADNPDSIYPEYFTYIKERIVLIYCVTCLDETLIANPLSEDSKTKLREKLEPFLVPTAEIKLPGKTGEIETADFRIQHYSIQPAFEILVNGSGEYQINKEVKGWY